MVEGSGQEPRNDGTGHITDGWYLYLLGAVILLGLGFGALIVLGDGKTETGEDDTGLVNGLAYFTWLLSWLGAAGCAVLGVWGGARLVSRRRQRA